MMMAHGPWVIIIYSRREMGGGGGQWAGQGYFGQFFNFVFPHVSVVCARIIRRCSDGWLAGFFDCLLACLLPSFLACLLAWLLESCLRCSLLLRFSFTPKKKPYLYYLPSVFFFRHLHYNNSPHTLHACAGRIPFLYFTWGSFVGFLPIVKVGNRATSFDSIDLQG
jgi:hypothetical protein